MSMWAEFRNGSSMPLAGIPMLAHDDFAAALRQGLDQGGRIAACFGVPSQEYGDKVVIYAVLALYKKGILAVFGHGPEDSFASLTPDIPQLHLFEREIAEQYGVAFAGHPWFKPVRFHKAWNKKDAWGRDPNLHPLIGAMDYFQVEGDEVHEVGVGPVHAGIIEPGHFRFQCYGEKVLHLEISLGYQHRGIERLLEGGPWPRTPMQIETMAGDTTIGHMTAYCMVLEGLTDSPVSPRAASLRAVALELERLANHVGDIGALAGDVGFLPTASYCGRLRGDYLNMTAALCGSRMGRGLLRPGGVLFDAAPGIAEKLLSDLEPVAKQTRGAVNLFFNTPSVLARLENTGRVTNGNAHSLGLIGVAGRACNIDCDSRRFFAVNAYGPREVPALLETSGDVYARAMVRNRELQHSTEFIRERLADLPQGKLMRQPGALKSDALAVGLAEGWRGTVAHVALTDGMGRFSRYKVIDPSFFNWNGLALALRNEQISDFPLCNKSFNLSYCGFDL